MLLSMSSTSSSDSKDEIEKPIGVEMDDETVRDFIFGNTSSSLSTPLKEGGNRSECPSPDEFLEVPSSAGLPAGISWRDEGLFHSQESYSSLGEKGTTASVNAYGSILQISRYLGVGTSGIYSADPGISEPWYIRERMQELLTLSTDRDGGFGLCLAPQMISSKPRLQFLHNRWPRYTHNIGDLSVSIQYFANRGTVIQKYLFKRTQKSGAHTAGGADGDVSRTLHTDHAAETQAKTSQAQENQIQDAREQTQHSPGDCAQESKVEQKQTPENFVPDNESKLDETFGTTQKRSSIKDCLRLKSLLQIRESEWTDPSNDFNMDDPDDPSYDTFTGQNQYSLVVRHRQSYADETFELVIAIFVNGYPTKIRYNKSNGTYEIDLGSEAVHEFEQDLEPKSDTSLEITAAYRLQLMEEGDSWKSTLIPISVLDFTDLMSQNSMAPNRYGRPLSLSTSAHLDFIMKRNLEHILSVCSMPVSATLIRDDKCAEKDVLEKSTEKSQARIEEPGGGSPIALTCGDISGHHVFTSASFFAFQFLLAMYSHIEGKYYEELEKRILNTLTGHLEWIFLQIEKDPVNSSQFLAGYWANGRELTRVREYRNPQHTSLQIINAKEFASVVPRSKIPSWFLTKVDDFITKWISSLRESDSRDYCVFPRVSYWGEEEGYYLRDHVLICKALGITEVLEKLRRPIAWQYPPRNFDSYFEERKKRELSLGVYTPDKAKRRILKRFTTQNTKTNERMLATYRDTQNNSFLLDTEDTVLFYDEDKFFHEPSEKTTNPESHDSGLVVSDRWVRTLNVQTRHKRANDKDWQEPLQYALAIQMGKQGYQINSRSASDIFAEGLKVLLQSCSASGIFPGFLTRETQLSSVFDEDPDLRWSCRDSYWHTSLELPYVIWKCAKKRLEETSGQEKKQTPLEKSASANQRKANKQPQPQLDQPIHEQSFMPKFLQAKSVLGGQDFTDQKNVFEISDEWLVPCPEFLHFDPERSFKDILNVTTQRKISVPELRRLVIDIPKRRDPTDSQTLVDPQPCTNEEFFERLQQWRTKKSNMLIKKRMIWLSSNDKEAAVICPASVPESEQPALTGFFGRHNNRDKHFLDDPSARDNLWKTEFQLSFYQLEKQGSNARSKPEVALAKRIRRASMGFRFNGDFFDCYWTCHILNFGDWMGKKKEDQGNEVSESTQEVETLLNDFLSRKVGSSERAFPGGGSKKCAWHQRKVLELILFEEIIRKVTAGTQEILKGIKGVLDSSNLSGSEDNETLKDLPDKVKETVLFSKIDGNAYFSFSAQWEVIQQLLQVLDEDLSDTVKKIENWQDREKNRGNEKPRWTKKDEKRYRRALRRMQLSNAESVRELLQLQEKAQSLRSSLISRRDYIRDDLNLRGAENTRYFTYVTVVFLPLGFATGIFSMSETPGGTTLARMSVTAAITFLLTVIALYYAVVLFEVFRKVWAVFTKPVGKMKDKLEKPLGEVKRELKTRVQQTKNGVHMWVFQPLERLLLPFYIAYVLWRVLGGSMDNFFNNQEVLPPQNLNGGNAQRRDSAGSLPAANTQDQPAKQRRPASLPDLENQIRPRYSFG